MSDSLVARLAAEIARASHIDPHSHIEPQAAAATCLADILGYHYFTELAHSAGIPRDRIEGPEGPPEARLDAVVAALPRFSNTVQHAWLIEIARDLFGFRSDALTPDTWRSLDGSIRQRTAEPGWADHVLSQSRIEAVFLTNDFDDPLTGFDTDRYVPCLRVDELVFHTGRTGVLDRLAAVSGVEPVSTATLQEAIGRVAARFRDRGARAAAISLPPGFRPRHVSDDDLARGLEAVRHRGTAADAEDRELVAQGIFWHVARCCGEQGLPFDLMIGVRRGVYSGGVHQGQDLLDGRLSLADYAGLFNAFPDVRFPVSVLSHPLNHELVSFAWIFPNVLPFGHWWYANTPATIERDLEQRLEAVPRTKLLGYYSDMYKLEFGYPKFAMYRRVLARVLARRFVVERGWSEEAAVELGLDLLVRNPKRVFYGESDEPA
jgi:glucuronate isomerase